MLGVPIEVQTTLGSPESFDDPTDGRVAVREVARRWGDERIRVSGEASAVEGMYDLARSEDGTWRRVRRWVSPIDRSAAQLSLL